MTTPTLCAALTLASETRGAFYCPGVQPWIVS